MYMDRDNLPNFNSFEYYVVKVTVNNNGGIIGIDVISGGKNYQSPPILVIVDPETRNVVGSGAIEPQMTGSTITGVDILTSPNGQLFSWLHAFLIFPF